MRSILVSLMILSGSQCYGAAITWNGGPGNWSTAADWSSGTVPGSGDSPTVNTGSDLVTLDIAPTIDALTLGGATGSSVLQQVSGGAQTLTINNTLTINQSGTLTLANTDLLQVGASATVNGALNLSHETLATVGGNLTNGGTITTNFDNSPVSGFPNGLVVTGALINNAGASLVIDRFNDTADFVNAGTLTNNGFVQIGSLATLNLTSQPKGVTDVVAGSTYQISGNFNAGSNNALAQLTSVEGTLQLWNGQTTSVTPTGGTLTLSSSGVVDVDRATTLTVNGNVANSGTLTTNNSNLGTGANTITISGTLTNTSTGSLVLDRFNNNADVANIATLVNNGLVQIGSLATLNLTSQPNGVTDIVAGSAYQISGNFNAGSNNALAQLTSVEGTLQLWNGQTTSVTPTGGALTLSSSGVIDVDRATTLTVNGNVANSGTLATNNSNLGTGANTINISGTLTNASTGSLVLDRFNNNADVANIATLVNNGLVQIGSLATLNLTSQPNGVTDIVAGSAYQISGNFKAGTANAFAQLTSVEGTLQLWNGQTTSVTPTGGALTLSSSGVVDVDRATTLTVNGNVANSGTLATNNSNLGTGANTINISGTLTNTSTGSLVLDRFNNNADVANIATLVNNGLVQIGSLATLNLTSQPNGVTDVVAGSAYQISGNFKAGTANAFAQLTSVEGTLQLWNGQTTSVTPTGGALTLSSSGVVDVDRATTLTVNGNVANSGTLATNNSNLGTGANTINISGTLTNTSTGSLVLDRFNNNADVANIATLVNNGLVQIGSLATLNLTSQPNGVTDVVAGSAYQISGNFKAGTANAFAQLTSVEGTLQLWNGQTTSVTPTGGALTLSSSGVVDVDRATTLSVNGNVANSGLLTTNNNNLGTGANTINISGTLTNTSTGSLVLDRFNNNADVANIATLVNNGFVQIGSLAKLNLTGAGTSTNTNTIDLDGGVLAIASNLDNTGTVETLALEPQAGRITDAGTFTNGFGGVFTLANTHDFFEADTFASGGTASVASGALMAVGAGTPTATSGLQVLADGTLDELISSATAFGQINVTGAAALDGTLDILLANGFAPTVGENFTIIGLTPGELSGTFASVLGASFNGGTEQFNVIYNNVDGSVELSVVNSTPTATPEPSAWILAGLGLSIIGWRFRSRLIAR